jgi:hypothetical protein
MRLSLGALAILAWQSGTSAIAASPLIAGQFIGQANAIVAQALAGPLLVGLSSGSSEGCPCSGTNGAIATSTVSALSVGVGGTVLTTAVNRTTASGLKTATTATTSQTANIAKINLLNGLVTADAVKAVAGVGVTKTALTTTFAGSTITNLVVAGKAIPVNVAKNTVINLAGLGTITVKFVNTATYGKQAVGIEVEMLRVDVNATNALGLPVGAVLIVGEASAGYNRVQPAAAVGGFAETLGVTASAGSALQASAAAGAISGLSGCAGTGPTPLSDEVANLSAPGLLTLGTATATAFSGPVGAATVATTTSTIANVSLLGGLISATGLKAVASESFDGTISTASTAGSTFGTLLVAGIPISNSVPPNTVLSLPGIGYVVLNEQPPAVGGHVQVNGLHIVVSLANTLGLGVGTEILVSHADASATAF